MPGSNRRLKRLKQSTLLSEVSGFLSSNPSAGDLLIYDAADDRYENGKALAGSYTLTGDLTADDLTVTNNVSITNALTANGDATLGTLSVTGVATLNGATTVASTLNVTGNVTLDSALTVAGALTGSSLSFSGNGQIDGDLTVDGTLTAGTLSVSGLTLTTLTATNATVSNNLAVTSALTVGGALSAGSVGGAGLAITGPGSVTGNLDVGGTLSVSTKGTLAHDNTDFTISNTKKEGLLLLKGNNTSGTTATLASLDPDGEADFYYNGVSAAFTDNTGLSITPSANANNPSMKLVDTSDVERARWFSTATKHSLRNSLADMTFEIEGRNTADSAQHTILAGDPDAEVSLYYNNVKTGGTHSNGIQAFGSGTDPSIRLRTSADAGVGAFFRIASDAVYVDAQQDSEHVKLRGRNSSSTEVVMLNLDPDTRQTYTPTNVSTDRSFDANSTTLAEIADVLGTLIADLQAIDLFD